MILKGERKSVNTDSVITADLGAVQSTDRTIVNRCIKLTLVGGNYTTIAEADRVVS